MRHYESYLATLAAAEAADTMGRKLAILQELDLHPIATPEEFRAAYAAVDKYYTRPDDSGDPTEVAVLRLLIAQVMRCKGPQFNAAIVERLQESSSWLPPGRLIEFHTGMATDAARIRLAKLTMLMALSAQNRIPEALPVLRRLEEKEGTLSGIAQNAVLEYGDPADLERWLSLAGKQHMPFLTSFGRKGMERVVQEIRANPPKERMDALQTALRDFSGEDVRDIQLDLLSSQDNLFLSDLGIGIRKTVKKSRGNPKNRLMIEALVRNSDLSTRGRGIELAAYDQGGPWAYDLVLNASRKGNPSRVREDAIFALRSFGCRDATITALMQYQTEREPSIKEAAGYILAELRKLSGCDGQK